MRSKDGDYLASDTSLQEDGRVVVNELQLLQHVHSLLVVRYKLEILIRQRHLQLRYLVPQNPLAM